jgi:hypothetical protein
MKFSSRTYEEIAADGFTHALHFSASDITAGLANNATMFVNVAPLPVLKAGMVVKRTAVYLNPAFSQSGTAGNDSTTLSIGDAGSATRFISGVQININGTEVITSFPGTENTIYTSDSQMSVTLTPKTNTTISSINLGAFYALFAIENFADPARAQIVLGPGASTGWT